ncbi:zinc finger protein 575-like [Drosophila subpulchrella]|uniref:zinc finger protein 575-like n=1 Tax=Drosophila subpulchrella TaxID=1486046 RepID=UPI0018A18F97|nr:zinc finger protein 575-like [Drosophila subpulchrella]
MEPHHSYVQVKKEAIEEEFLDEDEEVSEFIFDEKPRHFEAFEVNLHDRKDFETSNSEGHAILEPLVNVGEEGSGGNEEWIQAQVKNEPIEDDYPEEDVRFDETYSQVKIEDDFQTTGCSDTGLQPKKKPTSKEVPDLKCPCCPNTHYYSSILRRHLLSHKKDRPHRCSYCPKSFTHANTLSQHIRTHIDGLFKCPQCSKTYSHKSTLKNHILKHSDLSEEYKHSYCIRSQSQNMIYNVDRPKKCPHCPQIFSRNSLLTKHFLTHKEVGPHKCSFCPLYFDNREYLANHEKTHR